MLLAAAALLAPSEARGHGWHGGPMATGSPEEWLADVKAAVPDIFTRPQAAAPRAAKNDKSDLRSGRSDESRLRQGKAPKDLKNPPGRSGSMPSQGSAKQRNRGRRIATRGGAAQPAQPAQLDSRLTPQQEQFLRRKGMEALDTLAFLDPANIFPEEFPTFPVFRIPEYRQRAQELLDKMGIVGTALAVSALRAELMGNGRSQNGGGMVVRAEYLQILYDMVRKGLERDEVSAEQLQSLREAAPGHKPLALTNIARCVIYAAEEHAAAAADKEALAALFAEAEKAARKDGGVLLAAIAADDLRKRLVALSFEDLLAATRIADNLLDQQAYVEILRRMPKMEIEDLIRLARVKDQRLRAPAFQELPRRFHGLSVIGLMDVMGAFADSPLSRRARAELSDRVIKTRYTDVKGELEKLIEYWNSPNAEIGKAAGEHLANAFQRAPMRDCLVWLGRDDEPLRKLIWEQIDGRLARADGPRKTLYDQTALEVLSQRDSSPGSRAAALELLTRVQDAEVVAPLVDLLPKLPRDEWPRAGAALKRITGQDFGPRTGDGDAELVAAQRRWREWLKAKRPQ